MGMRNSFLEKYGGSKYFLRKIWGRETFFGKNMGVQNVFGKNYGGTKFFPVFFWKLIRPGTRNWKRPTPNHNPKTVQAKTVFQGCCSPKKSSTILYIKINEFIIHPNNGSMFHGTIVHILDTVTIPSWCFCYISFDKIS